MRILGWVLFAAACGFFVLQGVFLAASDYSMTSYEVVIDHVFPLLGLGAIVGAGVGALIVSRYPRNLVGWLFLIGQLGNAVGLAADAFGALVRQGIVEAPMAGRIAAFLTQFSGTVFTVCVMAVIFMIVPDGHLLSRRWRVAAAVPVLSMLLWWTGGILAPAGMGMPGATGEPGLREGLGEVLIAAGFLATLLSICLGAVALVLRLRRSTGLEHLRLRWIATGAAALAVTFVLFALSDLILEGTPWILTIATCLAYALFPVSVGVAIFRYRLFDIDVILNRAVVLGLLVVFVTIGYIAVVVAIGAVLRGIGAPGSVLYWPSLVATALVAAAFQPLRGRVLRLADRLVYGQRAVPYEALASLSRRLADSPSPDGAPARVAEAAGRAVGAAAVTVRLGRPDAPVPVRAAAWSDTAGTTGSARVEAAGLVLPVHDMGEQIGCIEVTMPRGQTLRTFERRLLQDVAAQAGIAFRNALLEAELAGHVRQGLALSADLEASRRRLVGVEDEARERLADAIQRRVVPHLVAVDAQLGSGEPTERYRPERLDPLITEVERALEELRTVCHGVFPALLQRRGLVPALSTQLDRTHPHTRLVVDDTAMPRLAPEVEAAGYLFCLEVTPSDHESEVELRVDNENLNITVTGGVDWADGFGSSADIAAPGAWQHSRDRVAALDGTVNVQHSDLGITVFAAIPVGPATTKPPPDLSGSGS